MATRPPERILDVDDEGELRLCVQTLLRTAGYLVDTAATGRDGLACLRGPTRYDLDITDQWMPRATGAEMLAEARAEGLLRGARTCVYTSDPEAVPGERVLVKPMMGAAFRGEVARMLAEPGPGRSRRAHTARWALALGAGATLMMASLLTLSAVTGGFGVIARDRG